MIPLRVGICIIDHTRGKFPFPKILEDLCLDNSIEFVVIDMNRKLDEQGPFDVILHKILEWYNLGEEAGHAKLQKLLNYVRSSPRPIKMLDPIEATVRLADRYYSMDVLKHCEFQMNGIKVFVPKFAFLEKTDSENAMEIINKHGLRFPLLTKPPATRCDAEAHDMSIIFSEHSIGDVISPCVLQEFVNHSSMLYKVATVDDHMYICERPSVKNLESCLEPTVYFDSMTVSKINIYNEDLHDANPKRVKFRTSLTCPDRLLDEDVVRELLRRITERIGLTLLGIDIIIEETTGNYGVIDLNYLPSYAGVCDQFANDLYRQLARIGAERSLTAT